MKKIDFKKVTKFYLYGEQYEMFKTKYEQVAFLKVLDNGEYEYPSYHEFALLTREYIESMSSNHPLLMSDKYSFLPLIKENVKGKIRYVMITSALVLSTLVGIARTSGAEVLSYDDAYQEETQLETEVENTNTTVVQNISLDELSNELEQSVVTTEAIDDLTTISSQEELIEYLIKNKAIHTMGKEDYDIYEKFGNPLDHPYTYYPSENSYTLLDNKLTYAAYETKDYTKEEVLKIIKNNNNLNDDFKKFAIRFVNTMDEYYDGLDYHLFAKNMEKLRLNFKDKDKMVEEVGGQAFFDSKKGLMILPDSIDYSQPYYQILVNHELGHMFNNYAQTVVYTSPDGKMESIKLYYSSYYYGHGIYLSEAVNTLFTSKPFYQYYSEERKKNFGYSLISNEFEVMINSANYDLKNCVNDNIYEIEDYFEKNDHSQINFNHLVDLLECQWKDFKNPNYDLSEESINEISNYVYSEYKSANKYDYISTEEKEYYDELFIEQILKGTELGTPNFNFDIMSHHLAK